MTDSAQTVRALIARGKAALKAAGLPDRDAEVDSALLWCGLAGISRGQLVLTARDPADPALTSAYEAQIARRADGEPLQYIQGQAAFMGLTFLVDDHVLIPRFDTEILAEAALTAVDQLAAAFPNAPLPVLDLCTGSGALGLTIASLRPAARVTCTDLSSDALAVAVENGRRLGVSARFLQGDLFQPVDQETGGPADHQFALIVSNPPYIPTKEIQGLSAEVRDHEPKLALDGGPDGLAVYRRIVPGAADHLLPGGVLLLEIGWDQRQALSALLRADGRFEEISCLRDLAGKDRVVRAVRSEA